MVVPIKTIPVSGKKALRVLVAEDNVLNQKMAVAALSSLGHTGIVVNDGEKAMRCLAQLSFDLVLMDVMMPVMDGMEALAAIRARERQGHAHLPVIMATSHNLPGDRERYLLSGADGYVAKPLDFARLQTEITRVLKV